MRKKFPEFFRRFVENGFDRKGRLLLHESSSGVVVVAYSTYRSFFSVRCGIWLDRFAPRPQKINPLTCCLSANAEHLCGQPLRFDADSRSAHVPTVEERFDKDYAYVLSKIPELAACMKPFAHEDFVVRAFARGDLSNVAMDPPVRAYLTQLAERL